MAKPANVSLHQAFTLIEYVRARGTVRLDELANRLELTPDATEALIRQLRDFEFLTPEGESNGAINFDFRGHDDFELGDAEEFSLSVGEDGAKLVELVGDPIETATRIFTPVERAYVLTGLDLIAQSAQTSARTVIDALRNKLLDTGSRPLDIGNEQLHAQLVDAIERGRRVELLYSADASDAPVLRQVDPLRIDVRSANTYLNAYCYTRCALRWFRFDRIRALTVLDTPRGDYSEADIQRPFTVGDPMTDVLVRIRPRVLPHIEQYREQHQTPRRNAEGWMSVKLTLRSPQIAARLAAEHAGDFVVLEPAGYRADVANLLAGALEHSAGAAAE